MRRPSKDSTHKLSADSQRLITLAQALGQSASRIEERNWERVLDAQLHKLLRTGHQDTVDSALNSLFSVDLPAYDILMSRPSTEEPMSSTRATGFSATSPSRRRWRSHE